MPPKSSAVCIKPKLEPKRSGGEAEATIASDAGTKPLANPCSNRTASSSQGFRTKAPKK